MGKKGDHLIDSTITSFIFLQKINSVIKKNRSYLSNQDQNQNQNQDLDKDKDQDQDQDPVQDIDQDEALDLPFM